MESRIKNCFSCLICELNAVKTCRDCEEDFCIQHYVLHLERSHGFDLTKRDDCLRMAERSMQDQFIAT